MCHCGKILRARAPPLTAGLDSAGTKVEKIESVAAILGRRNRIRQDGEAVLGHITEA